MKEIISPVDTEDGLFHDGDPSTGTEGTVVSQKWLNPVQGAVISSQQEMAAVLKEAGIKIDPSKQDQLLAAIKKITGTATEGFLKAGAFGLGGGPVAKTDAYSNIAQFYRVNDVAANKPPITGTAAGVVCLPIDGAPSTGYLAISIQGDAWIGRSGAAVGGVTWNRVFTTGYKPKPDDVNAYSKEEANGRYAYKSITVNGKPLSSNVNLTAGDVNAWNKTEADGRFIYKTGDTINGILKNSKEFQSTSPDNFRIIGGAFGTFWRNDGNSFYLMLTNANDQYGNYNSLRPFSVNVKTGSVTLGNGIHVGGEWPAITTSTGTTWHPDGNVQGSCWGGYLSNWLNTNVSNAQNNAQNWAYQNLVQNVRLTGRINRPDTGGQIRVPDGCVFTGMSGANYDPSIWASYSYVQVLINGSWRNIGTS
ncbi:hypothetical protein SMQC07_37820 [Serratia marcescens]|nr:hypothetical protein SMQC07_37820 [Serratia marcescens]BEN95218.1 hypothetical protein SMQC08_38310 [Serratia marcescens]BEO00505.1 hypothetical protein SMQC11_37930 [Serratia marcescens]